MQSALEFLMRIGRGVEGGGLGFDCGSDDDGGLLAATPILVCINSSCSDRVAGSE